MLSGKDLLRSFEVKAASAVEKCAGVRWFAQVANGQIHTLAHVRDRIVRRHHLARQ